jgi:hypothetical protein
LAAGPLACGGDQGEDRMTEDAPGASTQPGLAPDLILRLATSFMATRYLMAADRQPV